MADQVLIPLDPAILTRKIKLAQKGRRSRTNLLQFLKNLEHKAHLQVCEVCKARAEGRIGDLLAMGMGGHRHDHPAFPKSVH